MSFSQIPKGWTVITSFYLCNDDIYNPSHVKMGDPMWHESDYSKEKYKAALRNPNLWVFWVKIAKFKVNLRYSYCSKLIGKLRETEFRQWRCRNSAKKAGERIRIPKFSQKPGERRENNQKAGGRKCWISAIECS